MDEDTRRNTGGDAPAGSEDYLFDGTGPVDQEIAHLEAVLRPLARRASLAVRPSAAIVPQPTIAWPAAAAVLLLAVLAGWFRAENDPPGFRVVDDHGRPVQELRAGEWLEPRSERVRIHIADIGTVDVEPNSRVGLLSTSRTEHRLRLEVGRMSAKVDAPPRLFLVETPAATAVDLGCAYTLEIEEGGDGFLEVRLGFVLLENPGTGDSFVPRGSRCTISGDHGPGIPYVVDAVDAVRDVNPEDPVSVRSALEAARTEDTLTLFHLIERLPRSAREDVLVRIEGLVEPLEDMGIDRDRLLRADPGALEELRDTLWFEW